MCGMADHRAGKTLVFLHIGPPKTGTTFIQGTLRHWQKDFADLGIVLPGDTQQDYFRAAVDVRGDQTVDPDERPDRALKRVAGAWPRLVAQTLAVRGTAIISHEAFSGVDEEHAHAAVNDLAETDLHLVVTARDPERHLVSGFQQRIKNGETHEFSEVKTNVETRESTQPSNRLPELLVRWGSTIAPDHVHVVTVPPSGSDPRLLWERFARVVGIDSTKFGPAPERSNESLGVAEIELLRRVNLALGGRLPRPRYARIVRTVFANRVLAGVAESPRPALPEMMWPVVDKIADGWIAHILEQQYDVSGDVEDLRPRHRTGRAPDSATPDEVVDAAVRATAELLLVLAERSARDRSADDGAS
jgi:hypothetical protein